MDEGDAEEEFANFVDEVHKEIITEAPPEAWHQPKLGDVVAVEIETSGGRKLHKWTLGSAVPSTVHGLDVDRCVRTMRCGETALVQSKKEVKGSATLRLVSLERNEDILGDGRLTRRTLQEGHGWKTPKAPSEVVVRYSWHAPGQTELGQAAKEVTMSIMDGSCTCSSADWIPGFYGLRVLMGLRVGQQCLVQLSSELVSALFAEMPSGGLEYDIELLQIFSVEDISLDGSGKVMKKVTREGEGSKPVEGAVVKLRMKAADSAEQEISIEAASGRLCAAVEETVLSMTKGEICEVSSSDPEACREFFDSGEGQCSFALELLSFEELDVFSSEESRVDYCRRRKEVGSQFFKNNRWRQALKRYQVVTSNLGYLHNWKNEVAKMQAMDLRKACHLNIAACWLKLQAWVEASKACDAVLADEPQNVKALFRRGQSMKELREFREAEKCFRKVLVIEDNKEATRMLVHLRQLVKAEVEQQKEMFSRMAQGIAEKEDEAAELPGTGKPADTSHSDLKDTADLSQRRDSDLGEEEDQEDTMLLMLGLVAVLACATAGYMLLRRHRYKC